jgi:chaperonin GroES
MIRPTRGYVLISPDKAEEKTASGFYVPDNAQEKPQKGTVIATSKPWSNCALCSRNDPPGDMTGNGIAVDMRSHFQGTNCGLQELPCKEGDKVYYKRWGGTDIKEDGKEYVIVKFDDILGIIE